MTGSRWSLWRHQNFPATCAPTPSVWKQNKSVSASYDKFESPFVTRNCTATGLSGIGEMCGRTCCTLNKDLLPLACSTVLPGESRFLLRLSVAEFFSPNLSRVSRQICRLAANFSVTKKQKQYLRIQSPCFFELADKFVGLLTAFFDLKNWATCLFQSSDVCTFGLWLCLYGWISQIRAISSKCGT
jgi:hypothetical protein